MTANIFDIVVNGHYELDKGAACPIVFAEDIRQSYSSVSLSLVVPVLLGPIGVPPPDEGVAALVDALYGRYCSPNASSYAAAQSEVRSCGMENREQ